MEKGYLRIPRLKTKAGEKGSMGPPTEGAAIMAKPRVGRLLLSSPAHKEFSGIVKLECLNDLS
jgi:hypothetical protein